MTAEPGEFQVTEATTVQGSLALGADANSGGFLVVWADSRNGSADLDIFGRMLDPAGGARSPEFPVAVARRGQAFPALAFDAERNRFLVVWTDWRDALAVDSDIYGRFVAADGIAEDSPVPIATARISQKFPAIGFDPVQRRYLVVWTDRRHGPVDVLYGRFLAADGGFLGEEFRIAASQGSQENQSVVFDRNRGRFLVVWWAREDTAIRATFIDGPDTPARIPTNVSASGDPRLASNLAVAIAPAANRYLVVWAADAVRPKRDLDVYGVFMDAESGDTVGRPFPIAAGENREHSAVVSYDSRAGRFLVAWLERRRNPDVSDIRVHGRFVAADGHAGDGVLLSDPAAIGPKRSLALGFSPQSGNILILWEDGRDGATSSRGIFGRTQ